MPLGVHGTADSKPASRERDSQSYCRRRFFTNPFQPHFGDTQHDECRWNYKVLAPEVVGSIPTGSIAVVTAEYRLIPVDSGAVAQWIERANRFIILRRRAELLFGRGLNTVQGAKKTKGKWAGSRLPKA